METQTAYQTLEVTRGEDGRLRLRNDVGGRVATGKTADQLHSFLARRGYIKVENAGTSDPITGLYVCKVSR